MVTTRPKRRIRVLADYDCWPTWVDTGDFFDDVDPKTLPVSVELADALLEWADEYDTILVRDNPGESAFRTPEHKARWVKQGRVLAGQVAKELGDSTQVIYFDRGLGHDVDIS
jgi:hypothetical protein